ncbi:PREDICTED: uncharacterized protein LOC104807827 [Tarenaya hassleriana]|uniref:uncharacterized protein LOC104807827 n=1 Tax=Tarenaya hassleriana TaxID=28532 RepID=UPI00053C59BE|nr:PREDICTED: uncharacterized protein LOC104807827 [Tarenaya hassleriana]
MQNDLAPGTNLTVKCKGGQFPLGARNLQVGEIAKWEFYCNLFGNTAYACSLDWGSDSDIILTFAFTRDFWKCVDCLWIIKPDGAYFRRQFNETMGYEPIWEKVYSWS